MELLANSGESAPPQQKRRHVATDSTIDCAELEQLNDIEIVNNSNNKKRQPASSSADTPQLTPSTPSPRSSKRWQSEPCTPSHQRHLREDSPPALQLPAPLNPLTETNLREHTQHTNPDQTHILNMTTSSVSSKASTSLTALEQYGVIINDNVADPPIIQQFIRDVIEKEREHETPGARRLHMMQPIASVGSESAIIALIDKWLMFRDEEHDLGGEEHISLCHETNFAREYVQHQEALRSLPQPRPDRANSYVSYRRQNDTKGRLKSPFTREDEEIIREDTIHDVVLFPWLTAQFKNAIKGSLEEAKWQCARDGVASSNYLRKFFTRAGKPVNELTTMHWSLGCNGKHAELYYHWGDQHGRHHMKRFCSAELGATNLRDDRNQQMVYMRKCLRNLLEYVKTERLAKIKEVIHTIQSVCDEAAKAKGKGRARATVPGIASAAPPTSASASTPRRSRRHASSQAS
ncbi:hypothetical protein N0V95_000510 [Ascochyta clinopodiicola]|nr:hypothetical protein N0V95_000510 [Ascochyta clinopodiicola]